MKKWLQQSPEDNVWSSILTVLAIKVPLFLLFAYFFHLYWPSGRNLNFFFNVSGDTAGYYEPCEHFQLGHGYTTTCRMPGLLPIYFFLRLLFSPLWTKTVIIFLQLLADTIATLLLARCAFLLSNKTAAYWLVLIVYSFSYFVAVWNHLGYSDAFAVAMLIYSLYFALSYKQTLRLQFVFWCGFFTMWSVFFRPAHLLVVPVFSLFFISGKVLAIKRFKLLALFLTPLLLGLSLWTSYNYQKSGKIIVLQNKTDVCSSSITPAMLSIRELIITWGEDIQPWAKGSAAEWFFARKKLASTDVSNLREYLTPECNADSLIDLKRHYQLSRNIHLDKEQRRLNADLAIGQSARFLENYRKTYPIKANTLNRLKLCARFIWPDRLDALPLPPFQKMNSIQKGIKIGYYLLLLFTNTLGFVACVFLISKKQVLTLIPLFFVLLLPGYFGYVEQRYLAPAYPFFILFSVCGCLYFVDLTRKKSRKSL